MSDEIIKTRQSEIERKLELISSRPERFLLPSDYKILTFEEATAIIDRLKKKGKQVVLVSGVFDLLHKGHFVLFEKAREYGDVLGVATPTDEQVRENKNPLRPITFLDDRLTALSHIEDVDFVFPQNSWSTAKLLRTTSPSVYVYTPWHNQDHLSKFIGDVRQLGVRLQQVDLDTSGVSSSKLVALIERLR